MTDKREVQELLDWLSSLGRAALSLEPLAGDVSRRRYFRALHAGGGSSVLVTYPERMSADCRRFATTTGLLETAGVRVPEILAEVCGRGLMLVEDAGARTLYDRESEGWDSLGPWIEQADGIIERLDRVPASEVASLSPPLDRELLGRELEQTWEMLLEPEGLAGNSEQRDWLRAALDEVCDRLDDEPRTVCHRDFMARNLVPTAGGELVVLDHQDLRLGPAGYDLASLLNDSLFAPPELEERLLVAHRKRGGRTAGYRRCTVQRTLKAAGTFATFARRGERRHLVLVPRALERAARNLSLLPEGRDLPAAIETLWTSGALELIC